MKFVGPFCVFLAATLTFLGVRGFRQERELSAVMALANANHQQVTTLQTQLTSTERSIRTLAAELNQSPAADVGRSQEPSSQGPSNGHQIVLSSDPTPLDSTGFNSNSFLNTPGPASPDELNKAALFVFETAQSENFLTVHPAANSTLQSVTQLTAILAQDDGHDPQRTTGTQRQLATALTRSVNQMTDISKRPVGPEKKGLTETAESIRQAQQLEAMLSTIKNRLPAM